MGVCFFLINLLWGTRVLMFVHLTQGKWERAFVLGTVRPKEETTRVFSWRGGAGGRREGWGEGAQDRETPLWITQRCNTVALRKCWFNCSLVEHLMQSLYDTWQKWFTLGTVPIIIPANQKSFINPLTCSPPQLDAYLTRWNGMATDAHAVYLLFNYNVCRGGTAL